eukprot:m.178631 g.178631  ORF g.178631 m.178631 type:complete len:322 (-) comp14582_c0_seq1:45-1010(-)
MATGPYDMALDDDIDPDLLLMAQASDDDVHDMEADAVRLAKIREGEQRAQQPWRHGSEPITALTGNAPRTITLHPTPMSNPETNHIPLHTASSLPSPMIGAHTLTDSSGAPGLTVRYAECTFPPHGGEIIATGNIAWDASLVLAHYLATHPSIVAGASVIELGAGVAIPALSAAQLGASVTFITDVADRLPLIRSNMRLNSNVTGVVSAAVLPWGDTDAAAAVVKDAGTLFDVVLCSDVLFSIEAIEPLVQSIAHVAAQHGTVLSCCEHRFPGAVLFYDRLRAHGFQVEAIPLSEQHALYHHESIHLYRATRQQHEASKKH